MPAWRIEKYFNSHYNGSPIKWKENTLLYRFEDSLRSFFLMDNDTKMFFNFNDVEEMKHNIKRWYPNDYIRFNTMYACAYFYKVCLIISNIQKGIRQNAIRRNNYSQDYLVSDGDLKLFVAELNGMRSNFLMTDIWKLEDEFQKTIYKDFKNAIITQLNECHVDTRDAVEKMKDNTIGCLGLIILIISSTVLMCF